MDKKDGTGSIFRLTEFNEDIRTALTFYFTDTETAEFCSPSPRHFDTGGIP